MADEVDITTEREEHNIANAILASRKAVGLKARGTCHWCEEPVGDGVLFCSVECRDDHERVSVARKRAGL